MSINTHAKYTVVLNELLRHPETKVAVDEALSTYPLYKGKKFYDLIPTREELNKRLLNHYKYREIGFETTGRFVDELEITMCEIMPYYNEMFKTIEIMADLENPFDNVDVIETYNEKNTGETSGTSSGNTTADSTTTNNDTTTSSVKSNVNHTSKNVQSETPSNELEITADNIDSVSYADKVTWNKDTNTDDSTSYGSSSSTTSNKNTSEMQSTSTGVSTGTTEHTLHRKGNQGVNTYAHDMNEFRTSIIDVVNDIITDERVAELFMLVY